MDDFFYRGFLYEHNGLKEVWSVNLWEKCHCEIYKFDVLPLLCVSKMNISHAHLKNIVSILDSKHRTVGSCCHWCQWFDWLISSDWLMSNDWLIDDWCNIICIFLDENA